MKNYFYYSSILAVFTEAVGYHVGVDIKLFYFILGFNYMLLLIYGKIHVNGPLLLVYLFLLLNGLYTISLGDNLVNTFAPQLLGIVFVSLYYFNFFVAFQDDLEDVFSTYTYVSFWLAVLGILIVLVNLAMGEFVFLKSIMLEPAHYVTAVVPAYFYALKNKKFPRYIFFVLLISIVLSGSSVGMLVLCLSILLIPDRIRFFRLMLGALCAAAFMITVYVSYEPFRERADHTVRAIETNDFTGLNVSAYALTANLYVARKSFEAHPFFGSGLGSHELSREKHIYDIKGIEEFKDLLGLNAKDANSLMLRVMSDLGAAGLALVVCFLAFNYRGTRHHAFAGYLSKALILYFFCKLLREGHYFSPEMYFFVFGYAFIRRMEIVKDRLSEGFVSGVKNGVMKVSAHENP